MNEHKVEAVKVDRKLDRKLFAFKMHWHNMHKHKVSLTIT